MRTFVIFLASLLVSCAATNDPTAAFEKELSKMTNDEVNNSYTVICSNLENARKNFQRELKSCSTETQKKNVYARARKLLITTMSDSMFLCWYGTEWDFNGVTTTPRSGNVACGYFVTTLVEQAGFRIERTKLAQCASQSMITTLCPKKDVKVITNNDVAGVKKYLLSKPDGIFIMGLDSHTGFMVKKDSTLRFVHSNYTVVSDGVMSEPFDESHAIQDNGYFAIGNFLQSDSTIMKWINGASYKMSD